MPTSRTAKRKPTPKPKKGQSKLATSKKVNAAKRPAKRTTTKKKEVNVPKIDCERDDSDDRKRSEMEFRKVDNLQGFFDLWAKFYTNEVCTPGYQRSFLGDESNTLVDMELAKRIAKLTSEKHLLIVDSQEASISHEQRQYIEMIVTTDSYAKFLCTELNRHSGIVAYHSKAFFSADLKEMIEVNGRDDPLKHLYVTYNGDPSSDKTFQGEPYTHSPLGRPDSAYFIATWLNKEFLEKWSKLGWNYVVIIDTIHSNKGRCLDLLEKVTKSVEFDIRL
jgi:hypothetical protein